jgi:hypothetical protein
MTAQSDVHTALMARAEVMASGLSIDALWPRKGGEVPAGEYLTVYQLPNDNEAADLSSDVMRRQGFLIVTLVSLLNVYEAVSQERAGLIAAYFPRALRLNANSTTTTITSHTVKPGRQVGERWETPIWISYWSMS